MPRTRLSICQRKQRFASEDEAVHAALAATIALRPYRCDRCRQFHLTSRLKGKRRLVTPPANQFQNETASHQQLKYNQLQTDKG